MPEALKLKIVLCGMPKIGKTICFNTYRFQNEITSSPHSYRPTIGADYGSKRFNDRVELELRDTGGTGTIKLIIANFARGADLVYVFCDLNDAEGLNKVLKSFKPADFMSYINKGVTEFILVGVTTNAAVEPRISADALNRCKLRVGFNKVVELANPGSLVQVNALFQTTIDAHLTTTPETRAQALKIETLLSEVLSYSAKRAANPSNYYLSLSWLFGGISREAKLAAVNALQTAIVGGRKLTDSEFSMHHTALAQGELGRLYHRYLALSESALSVAARRKLVPSGAGEGSALAP